ncbi:GGDEF domain-containing protein [Thioalkalivibrio sp. ALE19]|uniref:GGDEF domain-containing protein n=1 Tax=Thioalkalivibrio sp. ALE19 TaxID=1266909 RepID=UPI00041D7BE8|nr:GGDEF domain-containing protein [Thioalkalivibrio sp. ALE19]
MATEPEVPTEESSPASLRERLIRMNLPDLVHGGGHAPDFRETRADYIRRRIRPLALLLAIGLPLWLPLEFFLLDTPDALLTMILRLTGAVAGLVLWWSCRQDTGYRRTLWRLALLLAIPMMLYAMARFIINSDLESALASGYAFFPALTVAALAIFPLTLREGAFGSVAILAVYMAIEAAMGNLGRWDTLGNLWLLVLVAGVAVWAALSQLHMLLRLYRQATRDPLTGLFNRGALARRVRRQLEVGAGADAGLCVLLFDLDWFKRINDTHGHRAGDRVLEHFAALLQDELRDGGTPGRWGGEEFLAVLPHGDLEHARALAERIRERLGAEPVDLFPADSLTVTASVGVACRHGGESLDALVQRADDALYAAKTAGRDCVRSAPVPT